VTEKASPRRRLNWEEISTLISGGVKGGESMEGESGYWNIIEQFPSSDAAEHVVGEFSLLCVKISDGESISKGLITN
jgi:hypothetical protein